MSKSKLTKRALTTSIIALVLCLALLIGATYAWFTDTVTAGRNTIVAGNLDIELDYLDEAGKWQPVKEDTDLFNLAGADAEGLWEPGHTEVVYLQVRNAGDLALEYDIQATVFGNKAGTEAEKEYTSQLKGADGNYKTFKLSEYLVVNKIDGVEKINNRQNAWIKDAAEEKAALGNLGTVFSTEEANQGEKTNVLYPEEKCTNENGLKSAHAFTFAVYMPTWVGNEANQLTEAIKNEGLPTIYLGVNLVAKQTPFEKDSFDINYDKNAEYPEVNQPNTAETEIKEDEPTRFELPITPSGEGTTVVEIEAGGLAGEHAVLTVDTNPIEISDEITDVEGRNAIAYVELTLTVDGEVVTEFAGKTATVTTLIDKNLSDVVVKYDGVGFDPTGVQYDANGQLVFNTTHFSRFVVYANTEAKEKPNFGNKVTLMKGNDFQMLIKATVMGTSVEDIPYYQYETTIVKSVNFREYDESLGNWEDGLKVDAENNGDIRMFFSEDNSEVYVCAHPETQIVLNEDSQFLFYRLQAMETVDFGGIVSTEGVTDMGYLFSECSALKTIKGMREWDTSAVEYMNNLFYDCSSLGSVNSMIADWDVSKVIDMRQMFSGYNYPNLDLSHWNTESLQQVNNMFKRSSLVNVKLFTNTPALKNMTSMFSGCWDLRTVEGLNSWDTSHVTNMSGMFLMSETLPANECMENLDLSGWDVSKVTDMSDMFYRCAGLKTIDLSGWDPVNNTKTSMMFKGCGALTTIWADRDWKTTSANSSYMFSGCENLVGGIAYDKVKTNGSYARINGGYFTDVALKPAA